MNGALFSDDTRFMAGALNELGIAVRADEVACVYEIEGGGGQVPSARAELFLGNSGTSIRFLTAFCALGQGEYHLDGVARMRQRPSVICSMRCVKLAWMRVLKMVIIVRRLFFERVVCAAAKFGCVPTSAANIFRRF